MDNFCPFFEYQLNRDGAQQLAKIDEMCNFTHCHAADDGNEACNKAPLARTTQ